MSLKPPSQYGLYNILLYILTLFLLSGFAGFYFWTEQHPKRQLIVLGAAQEFLPPDYGTWEISLSTRGESLEEVEHTLDAQEKILRKMLIESGLPETDIEIGRRDLSKKPRRYTSAKHADGTLFEPQDGSEEYRGSEIWYISTSHVDALEKAVMKEQSFTSSGSISHAYRPKFERRQFESVGDALVQKAQENGWKQAQTLINPGQALRVIREELFFPGRPDTLTRTEDDIFKAEARVLMTFIVD